MPGASAVIGLAPEFTVLAATDEYLQSTGATRALIGQSLFSAMRGPPEVIEAVQRSFEAACGSGDQHMLHAPAYGFGHGPDAASRQVWKMVTRAVPDEQGRKFALVHHVAPGELPLQDRHLERERQPVRSGLVTPQAGVGATPLLAELGALEPMFGSAPIGIAILHGPEHRIMYANAVELDLWGRTADQVLGRTVAQGLPELVEQGLIQALCDPVLQTGEPVVMTEQPMAFNRHGEGRTMGYFNAVHLPIRAETGAVTGLMAIAWEVTEAVLARQQVEELSGRLAARMDLEQHLIGIVSHDLRNPLSVILLSAQVLLARRTSLSPPQAELVERIVRVANRSIQLIRDLLDFTQARMGGRIPLRPRPARLRTILEPILEQMDVEHPGRISSDIADELAGSWDAGRVGQAVQNLLANAVQYSEKGSPVRLTSGQEGQEVWIAVHNFGDAIAPDLLASIFDPMRRAEPMRNSATRSIGMGLYITQRIALAHGGRVTVTSTDDSGTCFTIWLPVCGPEPGPEAGTPPA